MSSHSNPNIQLPAPHCRYCGFEMTPWQLHRAVEIEVLDQVYECRSCGVMTKADVPTALANSPAPPR
jgi:hypothetical protein